MYFDDPGLIEAIGVTFSILIIIVLIRKGWQLYQALIFAIIILALTNNNSASQDWHTLYSSITSSTAFYLVSMVLAITMLGHLHQKIGAMEELVDNLKLLIRDPRALIMIFPAAISLFSTVPGGAIISAPMVEETGKGLKMPALEMAMSNMVYRHLVVLIYPFTAGIILASGITGISIAQYLSFTVPVVAIVFMIATLYLLSRYPRPDKNNENQKDNNSARAALTGLVISSSPYLLAIILGIFFGIYFPLALLAGILLALFMNQPSGSKLNIIQKRLTTLFQGLNWSLALSILSIVVYKDFMMEADSIQQATYYLLGHGVPLIVIVVALPFLTGFITGNNAASLGITLPVLMPLLGPEMLTVRYFGIVYVASYAGYLGSPVHLCTFVTNDYFKTHLYSLIKQVNVFGAITLLVGLAISIFY